MFDLAGKNIIIIGGNKGIGFAYAESLLENHAKVTISGLFLFVTIIGAPFGIQAFKLAQLSLNPVGKKVVKTAVAKEVEAALARKDLSN